MSQTELTEPQKILKNLLSVTEGFAALGIDCEISGSASHTTVDLAYPGAKPKRLTIYPNKMGTTPDKNDQGTSHSQDKNHSQESNGRSSSRNGRNKNHPQGSKNKGNNKKGNSHGPSTSKGAGNSNYKGRNANCYQSNKYPSYTDLNDVLCIDFDEYDNDLESLRNDIFYAPYN